MFVTMLRFEKQQTEPTMAKCTTGPLEASEKGDDNVLNQDVGNKCNMPLHVYPIGLKTLSLDSATKAVIQLEEC